MGKRILVTGAAGFIGFSLSEKLLSLGHEVTGIDNVNDYYDTSLKYDRLKILQQNKQFRFHKLDLCEHEALRQILKKTPPDIIINLAAQAGVRYSIDNPFAYQKSNMEGFLSIIELAREFKVENFIFASSSSVYGNNEKVPFSIEDPVDHPISFYAATKKSNELTAYVYHHLYGLNVTGFRFFTVYGPWGRPDMAYFKFTKAIASGEPITVYEKGKLKRDFTYIEDILSGLVAAVHKPLEYEILNLGNHRSMSVMDMIQILENNIGMKAVINWEPMQPGDVYNTYADIERTKKLLAYEPRTKLETGLMHFVNWYKDYYNI